MKFADRIIKMVRKSIRPRGYVLVADAGDCALEIPEGETILGRSGPLAGYLGEHSYIARIQAKLYHADGKLTMRNYGTNPSFVNGEAVEYLQGHALHAGDALLLVDVMFHVREK